MHYLRNTKQHFRKLNNAEINLKTTMDVDSVTFFGRTPFEFCILANLKA